MKKFLFLLFATAVVFNCFGNIINENNKVITTYTVTLNTNLPDVGTTSGAGTYNNGETVTIVATPASGYQFLGWTENESVLSVQATFSFVITSNRTIVANFIEGSSPQTFSVSVSVNPAEGGTASGGGSYNAGDEVSVEAIANTGYTFSKWTENDVEVSAASTYTFSIEADRNLVATFTQNAPQTYEVIATSSPVEGGTITGGGTYDEGEEVSLVATPNTGYTFSKWTENDVEVSTSSTYTFTIDADRNLVAIFTPNAPQTYEVIATSSPAEGGTVTGGGTYNEGDEVSVVAAANTGYSFISWTENGSELSTNLTYTFTVTSNRTLKANFVQINHSITVAVNPENAGTIEGDGTYLEGQTANLLATPQPGFLFLNWTEGEVVIGEETTLTFTVTADRSIVANFEEDESTTTYTISAVANPAEAGSAVGAGSYYADSAVTLTAIANSGYIFTNWTEDTDTVSQNSTYEFIATSDRSLVANFEEDTATIYYTISATVTPENSGTITGAGSYAEGDSVHLIAVANEGFIFAAWVDNTDTVSLQSTYEFVAVGDRVLQANFVEEPLASYIITTTSNPVDGGSTTGNGIYTQGDSVTVGAVANPNFAFVSWTVGESIVSNATEYTFVAEANIDLVANFEATGFTITTDVNNPRGGVVSGAGFYAADSIAEIVATPNTGYSFTCWTENDTVVTTDSIYSFTVTSNRSFIAEFTPKSYEIIVSADTGGIVTGAGSYFYDATAILEATPDSSYIFLYWSENDEEIGYEPSLRFIVKQSRTIEAHFGLAADYPLGSRFNPLIISSVDELCAVRDIVNAGIGSYKDVDISNGANSKFFKLSSNIDLASVCNDSVSWIPIGSQQRPFKGNLNGNNKSVDNLTINMPENDNCGLFGQIVGSEIINLNLNNVSIVAGSNVGAICGYAHSEAKFVKCVANGIVKGMGVSVGGICGYMLSYCEIRNSINSCSVSGVGSQVGGICGYAVINSSIVTCANYGAVSGKNSYVGGICGFVALTSSINSSLSAGTIAGSWYRGSICGLNYKSTITNCFYDKQMSASKGINNKDSEGNAIGLLTADFSSLIPDKLVGELWNENYWVFSDNVYPTIFGFENNATVQAAASPIFINADSRADAIDSTFYTKTPSEVIWSSTESKIVFDTNVGHLLSIGNDTITISTLGINVRYIPVVIASIDSIIVDVIAENGAVTGDGRFTFGETAMLVATPSIGYTFVNWTHNNDTVSSSSNYSFTVTANTTLKANFAPNSYSINASTIDDEGVASCGFIEGTGNYLFNSFATLVAVADSAHSFVSWTRDGQLVSTNSTYKFRVDGDCELVANFTRKMYQITTRPGYIAQGSTSGDGIFRHGSIATVVANSYYGYSFRSWTENGEQVSTDAEYSFRVLENRNLVAEFNRSQYLVSIVNSEGHALVEGGTVTGNGYYNHGDSVVVTAFPDEEYNFIAWVEGRDTLSRNTSFVFRITEPKTLRACFRRIVSGIEDLPFELSVYPNPANQRFSIEHNGIQEIKIYDIIGKLVYSDKLMLGETKTTIECSEFRTGVYLLHFVDDNQNVHIQRIVIRH